MKTRYWYVTLAVAAVASLALWAANTMGPTFISDIPAGLPTPWTSVPTATANGNFSFSVFGDRTGFAYPGEFEKALAKIAGGKTTNAVNSKFIVSVGDQIEGYVTDPFAAVKMWEMFDRYMGGAGKPYFHVVGNHDMGNNMMRAIWQARFSRDYYYWVYQNVLFLALNTEDPPPPISDELQGQINQLVALVAQTAAVDPEKAAQVLHQYAGDLCDPETYHAQLGDFDNANISDAQVSYFADVLQKYPNVRWTFLFMHKPAWRKPISANFGKLQTALAGRNYTVFAGHYHQWNSEMIDGHQYYIAPPTAAIRRCDNGPDYLNQVINVHVGDGAPAVEHEPVK